MWMSGGRRRDRRACRRGRTSRPGRRRRNAPDGDPAAGPAGDPLAEAAFPGVFTTPARRRCSSRGRPRSSRSGRTRRRTRAAHSAVAAVDEERAASASVADEAAVAAASRGKGSLPSWASLVLRRMTPAWDNGRHISTVFGTMRCRSPRAPEHHPDHGSLHRHGHTRPRPALSPNWAPSRTSSSSPSGGRRRAIPGGARSRGPCRAACRRDRLRPRRRAAARKALREAVLINNAGMISPVGMIDRVDAAELELSLAVNFTAPILLMRRFPVATATSRRSGA